MRRPLRQGDHLRSPALGVHADGRGADEGADLDGSAHLLRDLGRRGDVRDQGAAGDVGGDAEAGHLPAERQDVLAGLRAGARQAHVRRVDAQAIHDPHERDVVEARVEGRGALEPVAQGLVVELDPEARGEGPRSSRGSVRGLRRSWEGAARLRPARSHGTAPGTPRGEGAPRAPRRGPPPRLRWRWQGGRGLRCAHGARRERGQGLARVPLPAGDLSGAGGSLPRGRARGGPGRLAPGRVRGGRVARLRRARRRGAGRAHRVRRRRPARRPDRAHERRRPPRGHRRAAVRRGRGPPGGR